MMQWHFHTQPPYMVDTEITQRDQFQNDDVDLSDALVREFIQNALDATPENSRTRVIFRWLDRNTGLHPRTLEQLMAGQIEHARLSGLPVHEIDFDDPSALVIEDFGTTGLTGSIDSKDNDNFSDFWRRHGKSHKSGMNRGRWGLGKLVYSSSSRLRSFFGLTTRTDDADRYLMGQTVLRTRQLDGQEYPPHAFYCEADSTGFQLPTSDATTVKQFTDDFSLTRRSEPGLSIVIPFPLPDIKYESLIGICILNYFYPILTNQLEVVLNELHINGDNIRELAHDHAYGRLHDIDNLFSFIEEVRDSPESELVQLRERWISDNKLDADDFQVDDLERLREEFKAGKLVGVRLPLKLTKKPGEIFHTYFCAFVKRPEQIEKGTDLYVRRGLTLPAEAKFTDRKAFGAMIANDTPIVSFLGDAENAAHTKWNSNAEMLKENWVNPQARLRVIRNSVVNLFDVLAQTLQEEDPDALQEYFFVPDSSPASREDKKKPKRRKRLNIISRDKLLRIDRRTGGFSIHPGPDADKGSYPLIFKVRMAYSLASGNPFKKYHPFDFDFTDDSGPDVVFSGKASLRNKGSNWLEIEASKPDFQVDVIGFDLNRDLDVKLHSANSTL